MNDDLPSLLVFSDDWGRHPSSCQHLIRHLLPRHDVLWVNLIGMRRPRLDLLTLKRGCDKLGQWFTRQGKANALPEALQVVNPLIWPWFRSRLDRWVNRKLLRRNLLPLLQAMPVPPIAITTQPTVVELVDLLPVRHWVYYCVDDFTQWPGLDHTTIAHLENRLIDRADRIVAASEALQARVVSRGQSAELLTHGIDVEMWQRTPPGPSAVLAGLQPPIVLFWGLVDRRLDVAFLRRLGQDMSEGTIVLVGPEDRPDAALASIPRLVRRPPVNYEELPALAHGAAVLVMPYADLPVTRALQPLKLKEYLATGKPTVVRDLPAVGEWRDCLDTAATPGAFSWLVRLRIARGIAAEQQRARSRLARESWAAKAAEFERLAIADLETEVEEPSLCRT